MPPADSEDDLSVLLDDLETTLSALQEELRTDERRAAEGSSGGPTGDSDELDDPQRLHDDPGAAGGAGGGEGRPDARRETPRRRRGPRRRPGRRGRSEPNLPRPPSITELFRFTEQYTLPTVISMLEATIRSLELLRGALRLADPERSAFEAGGGRRGDRSTESPAALFGSGVAGVGRGAVSGVERGLSELQTALSEGDLPADQTSRELLDEARRLSEEVADRLAEARRESESDRYGYRRDDRSSTGSDPDPNPTPGGVAIDVGETKRTGDENDRRGRDESDESSANASDDDKNEGAPEVDVEAELASIRDEVERRPGRANRREADSGDAGSEGSNGPNATDPEEASADTADEDDGDAETDGGDGSNVDADGQDGADAQTGDEDETAS